MMVYFNSCFVQRIVTLRLDDLERKKERKKKLVYDNRFFLKENLLNLLN